MYGCEDSQTDSTRKSPKKNHCKDDISCISLANKRLMDVTQLALTWVGWPNGEIILVNSVVFTAREFFL